MSIQTYKSYEHLKGNTLKLDDLVCFGKHPYHVCETFINHKTENNCLVFNSCGIYKSSVIDKIASAAYGYESRGGDWPCSNTRDYKALTRLALVMLQFCEGQKVATIDFDTYSIKVNKQGEIVSEEKEELTVSAEFVKEAHNAACDEWKKKIEEQFPSVFTDPSIELCKLIDSYPLFQKGICSDFRRECIYVIADSNEYYVVVSLPRANREWTFAAFDFVRWFVTEVNKCIFIGKQRVISAYPVHSQSTHSMIDLKLGIPAGECIPIMIDMSHK